MNHNLLYSLPDNTKPILSQAIDAQIRHWIGSWLLALSITISLALTSGYVYANPQLQKAIKHFNEFEIRPCLDILKKLEQDPSLNNNQKATVALYIAMSYAYLRNTSEAKKHFGLALQRDPSVQMPANAPARLKRMYEDAKNQSSSNDNTPPTKDNFDAPSPTPPASDIDPLDSPTPTPQPKPPTTPPPPPKPPTTPPPPPKREMSFDMGFSTRKSEPKPKPKPRATQPPAVFDTPPSAGKSTDNDPLFDSPPTRTQPPPRKTQAPPPQKRVAMTSGSKDNGLGIGQKASPPARTNMVLTFAWITSGLAVALFGGAIATGIIASSKAGLAQDPNTYQLDIPAIEKDAQNTALIANILYITAGVVAIGSVVLFIIHPRGKPAAPQKAIDDEFSQLPRTNPHKPLVDIRPDSQSVSLYSSP
jgi:hypothetical protein